MKRLIRSSCFFLAVTVYAGSTSGLQLQTMNAFGYSVSSAGDVNNDGYPGLLVGQDVATLVNEKLDAGIKAVEFQGKGLPGGVYFYRLQAGTYSESRKLLLLR